MQWAWRCARKALELDERLVASPNFNWKQSCETVERAIQVMSAIPGFPRELTLSRFLIVSPGVAPLVCARPRNSGGGPARRAPAAQAREG